MTEERKHKLILLISAAIIIATLFAYEPMRHNDFVNYDDNYYITANPDITAGLTPQSPAIAIKPHFGMWHPLTTFTNMLDCQLFGLNPFRHHLVNLIFHIANALLLFWILTKLMNSIWASAFIAAIFALHPLQVESVAWASELKTVLSGLFWLLTIAVYCRYTKRPSVGRYILLLVIYALCIMTKPIVVTLPLVLLLLDYWPLERLKWGRHAAENTLPLRRLLLEKVPLFILSAFLCVITFVAQQSGGAVKKLSGIPLDFRVANMFISYIRYIGKLIWPTRLAVFYPLPYSNFPIGKAIICAVAFVLITLLSIWAARRRKYVAVGWLWFVVTLIPVIGLVQSGDQAMADRYMYLPMLGLLLIAVRIVTEFFTKRVLGKVLTGVLATAILLYFLFMTRTQVRYWQNTRVLFEHALKVTENNAIAENMYGKILFNEGHPDQAVPHFINAAAIWPTFLEPKLNLGRAFLKQGKFGEAIACFNELVQQKDSAELHYNLAAALSMQKKYNEAINQLTRTLELNPEYPDAHNKMGMLLIAAGKPDEAITHLKQALETGDNEETYANLGTAYQKTGKNELAIQNWAKALQLKPAQVGVLHKLAWALATGENVTAEDANKAILYASNACELTTNKEPVLLDTLAAAYAAAGRFEDAITTANKALDIAKAAGQEALADEIQQRLKLYKSGQRYRQK